MAKSNLMKMAHRIAKTLEGDYIARLALALRMAWAESSKKEVIKVNKESLQEKIADIPAYSLVEGDQAVVTFWENYGKRRVYVKYITRGKTRKVGYLELDNNYNVIVGIKQDGKGMVDKEEVLRKVIELLGLTGNLDFFKFEA